ncbi:MAG: carboxypeptidase-like regulatory domain-containing protein [Gemmataceae bacterium]|nr:carboxypeptidase-like regulatory domain-containing protein [Gemmataceae bacterium]
MSRWPCLLLLLAAVGCARPGAPRSNVQLAIQNPSSARSDTKPLPDTRPLPDVKTKDPPPAVVPGEPTATANQEAGILSGLVRWEGAIDALAEKAGNRLRINPRNQGIADAVVWLVEPPGPLAGEGRELTLTQRDGAFQPHVETALRGSKLRMLSADPQATFRASGAADFSCMVKQGKPEIRVLDRPGLVEMRSELNPDALSHVWVFGHGYFAKTDADGHFRLPELKPGTYELTLWHEGWRKTGAEQPTFSPPVRRHVTVKLGDGQGATIQWLLSSRMVDEVK